MYFFTKCTRVSEIIHTPCEKHSILVFNLLNPNYCNWVNLWYFFPNLLFIWLFLSQNLLFIWLFSSPNTVHLIVFISEFTARLIVVISDYCSFDCFHLKICRPLNSFLLRILFIWLFSSLNLLFIWLFSSLNLVFIWLFSSTFHRIRIFFKVHIHNSNAIVERCQ